MDEIELTPDDNSRILINGQLYCPVGCVCALPHITYGLTFPFVRLRFRADFHKQLELFKFTLATIDGQDTVKIQSWCNAPKAAALTHGLHDHQALEKWRQMTGKEATVSAALLDAQAPPLPRPGM